MREDRRAVAFHVFRKPNPVVAREQSFELAFALFERCRPQVIAVQFDQVEGVETHGCVMRPRFVEPRRSRWGLRRRARKARGDKSKRQSALEATYTHRDLSETG